MDTAEFSMFWRIIEIEEGGYSYPLDLLNSSDYTKPGSNNCFYYTLDSLSVFSLAKSLRLILEISATYRLVSIL